MSVVGSTRASCVSSSTALTPRSASAPIARFMAAAYPRLRGSAMSVAACGQTGRQQFRVPTFVYVVDGILTTLYESGPVGIAGAQYHSAGQAFMDNGGWWHNHANKTDKPVKYILLHLGYPGRPDPIQKPDAE